MRGKFLHRLVKQFHIASMLFKEAVVGWNDYPGAASLCEESSPALSKIAICAVDAGNEDVWFPTYCAFEKMPVKSSVTCEPGRPSGNTEEIPHRFGAEVSMIGRYCFDDDGTELVDFSRRSDFVVDISLQKEGEAVCGSYHTTARISLDECVEAVNIKVIRVAVSKKKKGEFQVSCLNWRGNKTAESGDSLDTIAQVGIDADALTGIERQEKSRSPKPPDSDFSLGRNV